MLVRDEPAPGRIEPRSSKHSTPRQARTRVSWTASSASRTEPSIRSRNRAACSALDGVMGALSPVPAVLNAPVQTAGGRLGGMAHPHPHPHPPRNEPEHDPACAVAHGEAPERTDDRTLVAVFASPVARFLLRFGTDLGFRGVLLEPDPERAAAATDYGVDVVTTATAITAVLGGLDGAADVVVTDHHRPELGTALRDALSYPVRWVGVLGNPRHTGPHEAALAALGVPPEQIARVHRPVGLNIGSQTPAEIAVATLAGLIADRNGRPGGFAF